MDEKEWDQCEAEQKKEFSSIFDKFANELREALKSLDNNITLQQYDSTWQTEAESCIRGNMNRAPNQQMMAEFESMFNEWSEKIQEALEGADAQRKDEKNADPKQELEYWKQRMRKLTGISEQLKSKNCRTVYNVLLASSTGSSDQTGRPKDKIYLATSKWKSIELRVTEALNEAKDNVKYL